MRDTTWLLLVRFKQKILFLCLRVYLDLQKRLWIYRSIKLKTKKIISVNAFKNMKKYLLYMFLINILYYMILYIHISINDFKNTYVDVCEIDHVFAGKN